MGPWFNNISASNGILVSSTGRQSSPGTSGFGRSPEADIDVWLEMMEKVIMEQADEHGRLL
jgi:hypothetical protein